MVLQPPTGDKVDESKSGGGVSHKFCRDKDGGQKEAARKLDTDAAATSANQGRVRRLQLANLLVGISSSREKKQEHLWT